MLLCGTPASLRDCYAYETPPRRARSPRGPPHHFAIATVTPMIPRRAERVRSAAPRTTLRLLRLRLSAAPSMLLCGLAGSGLVLYAFAPPPMTSTFIPSTPPISLSFNFSFQLLDWPVGSDSLNISSRARWVVCPLGRTQGPGRRVIYPKNKGICSFFPRSARHILRRARPARAEAARRLTRLGGACGSA